MTSPTLTTTSTTSSVALEVADHDHAISIKLLPLYTEDPMGWYDQVEAQFGIWHITADDTKYWFIEASLDAATSSYTTHTLWDVADSEPYDRLRSFLIKIFSLSQHQRMEELLRMSESGDHLLTQYADHMWRTLGDHDLSTLLQILCCPLLAYVQVALISTRAKDLNELTK